MPSSKTESIPIPYTESQKVEQGYVQMEASRLNQMYECATWKMYDRIMNARQAKAKKRLEQMYMTVYDERSEQSAKATAAVAYRPEQEQQEKPEQSRQSDQPSPVRRRRMNQVSSEAFLCSSSVSSSSTYFVGSLEPLQDDENRQELPAVKQMVTCAMAKQDFICFGALDTSQCRSDSEDDDTKQSSTRSSSADSEDDDVDDEELMFDLHL